MNRLRFLLLTLLCCGSQALLGQDAPTADSYESAAKQARSFVLPEGFQIELVASEPDLINPLGMALDERGRIYVSESHTYRYDKKESPVSPPSNPIVRLDPLPDGTGFRRTPVANGFEDPVMSLLVRDGKLWCTNNDRLLRFDLDQNGAATNRQELLVDRNKAWNPFGMYTIEWGHDGLLYLSVSNHDIDIAGPTNKLTSRGSSGLVARMQPDGSRIERLVHGLRAPYPYELDPFGRLWVISNGEGNPNRFLQAIEGVDYHCYSRPAVDNEWLAGRHPLAPPCFELPRGACTQLLRYDAADFPASYRGNLLLANWGAHGFSSPNHTIYRYVLDQQGQVVSKEQWLTCTDPHFRPSHMLLAHDGSLLVADWYGRDDESDLTGRIWRIHYTGDDKPTASPNRETGPRTDEDAIAALASADHRARFHAINTLIERGNRLAASLGQRAARKTEPLGAANALWTLFRIGTPQAYKQITEGLRNDDARVRHLAITLLRRSRSAETAASAARIQNDPDVRVRVAAALALQEPASIRTSLLAALNAGAAHDPHLRYEAAWHLARYADENTFNELLHSTQSDVRLAGLIAVDAACYEEFDTSPTARSVLANAIADPGPLDLSLLLTLARINKLDALPALEALLGSPRTAPAVAGQAIQLLLASPNKRAHRLATESKDRLLQAVRKGTQPLATSADVIAYLSLLESDRLTPFDSTQLDTWLVHDDRAVRTSAHAYTRKFGAQSQTTVAAIWRHLSAANPRLDAERSIALCATLMAIEQTPDLAKWRRLLETADALVLRDVVRSWRKHSDDPVAAKLLADQQGSILSRAPECGQDLTAVLTHLGANEGLTSPQPNPAQRTYQRLADTLNNADLREASTLLGRRVFERTGCIKCHADTDDALRGPSLRGLAKGQPQAYFVESLLDPSKVIKTGFETELIETAQGRVLTGVVRDQGATLQIVMADDTIVVAKKDVAERQTQKVSLMPEDQEKGLSTHELTDLLAYLMSLK